MTVGPPGSKLKANAVGCSDELAVDIVATDTESVNAVEVKFGFCPFCEVRILRIRCVDAL
jgi:hypothetical protein